MSQTRRLAALLAADVAGYSRLMGADEEGTHERVQAHLSEFREAGLPPLSTRFQKYQINRDCYPYLPSI